MLRSEIIYPKRTAVPSRASTITTERRSQVDLKSKTGTTSSFQIASETNYVQGTVSYETRKKKIKNTNQTKRKSKKRSKKGGGSRLAFLSKEARVLEKVLENEM